MEAKERIKEYLNHMTEEQAENLLFVLKCANGNSNKGEMMKFAEKYNGVDSAIPYLWSEKVRDYGINTQWYAVSYQESDGGHGAPIHILEKVWEKLMKQLNIL